MKNREWQYDPEWAKWTLLALLFGVAIMIALANGYHAGRMDAEARTTPCPSIPTSGMEDCASIAVTATPEPLKFQVMKVRAGVPAGFATDPTFWEMLTLEGQEVLAGVTVVVSDEPRSYACPQVWEVGAPTPTPAVCTYYGGVYEGDTNTISLWGEAAQANPDILRHEALHALDAAGDRPANESGLVKAAGELIAEAEAEYNAGGGTWFRPNELYAMLPIVVGWDFDELPPAVEAYYAEWFLQAANTT
jgi:hypothetical protein